MRRDKKLSAARPSSTDDKVQARAGKGILTYRITDKTGKLAGIKLGTESDEIMLISSDGTIIRLEVKDITILGRATEGVTLMRTA